MSGRVGSGGPNAINKSGLSSIFLENRPIGVRFLDITSHPAASNHQSSLDPMGNSFGGRGTNVPEGIPKYTAQRNIS